MHSGVCGALVLSQAVWGDRHAEPWRDHSPPCQHREEEIPERGEVTFLESSPEALGWWQGSLVSAPQWLRGKQGNSLHQAVNLECHMQTGESQ